MFEGRICSPQASALERAHSKTRFPTQLSPSAQHSKDTIFQLTRTHTWCISLQKHLNQFADQGLELRGAATAIQGEVQLPTPLKPPCQIQPIERSLSEVVHADEWLMCRLHRLRTPLVRMMSHVQRGCTHVCPASDCHINGEKETGDDRFFEAVNRAGRRETLFPSAPYAVCRRPSRHAELCYAVGESYRDCVRSHQIRMKNQ
jgi:hypothetical protein